MRDAIMDAITKKIINNDSFQENDKKVLMKAWKPVINFVVFNVYYGYENIDEST